MHSVLHQFSFAPFCISFMCPVLLLSVPLSPERELNGDGHSQYSGGP